MSTQHPPTRKRTHPVKIELPNGVTIHLEDGENIDAVLPLLRAADPAPARLAAEETVAPGDTISLFVKEEETAVVERQPSKPKPKRPTEVYVTDIENQVIRLLRQHPEGLTSPQIAQLLNITVSKASVTVWRLRAERPTKDTTTPLVTKVTDGRHLITTLGKNLKLIVVKRPNHENLRVGWGVG